MNRIHMKYYTLITIIAFLGVTGFMTTLERNTPLADCYHTEIASYEQRWAQACFELGHATAMCKLPETHTEEMGWHDHVERSKSCEQIANGGVITNEK